jgi:hypothetical protein
MSPFLPGLLLALAVWILPLLLRFLPRRLRSPVEQHAPWLPGLAPWILSAALPYLGLLLGWIAGRDYGLGGHTPVEWILGLVAAVVLGILLGGISSRLSIGLGWGVVGDEARWTLYRAAAWPWAGFLLIAVAAGWLAALAEYAWGCGFQREKVFGERGLVFLLRVSGSSGLFLLTHNFFLAMLYYLAAATAASPDSRSRIKNALGRSLYNRQDLQD